MDLPVHYPSVDWRTRRDARKQYARLQGGLCIHCRAKLKGPPPKEILRQTLNPKLFPFGFLDYPVHLHHNHLTGMTIGAVHAHCNGVLWQYHRQ